MIRKEKEGCFKWWENGVFFLRDWSRRWEGLWMFFNRWIFILEQNAGWLREVSLFLDLIQNVAIDWGWWEGDWGVGNSTEVVCFVLALLLYFSLLRENLLICSLCISEPFDAVGVDSWESILGKNWSIKLCYFLGSNTVEGSLGVFLIS